MNTKRNKTKTLLFVGLLLAVAGLTLGFAAFSNTLTIKSSATVTPDSSTFSVQFSASETEILVGEENPVKGGAPLGALYPNYEIEDAIIDAENPNVISNLKVNFHGYNLLVYEFYVHNTGEYDAYLNEVIFHNVEGKDKPIVCKAVETGDENRATDALVANACDKIHVYVTISDSGGDIENTTLFREHKLAKGTAEKVIVKIASAGNTTADGPVEAVIGDIELVWSTVDVNATTTE